MKRFLLSLLLCISSVVNATNTEFTTGTLDIINLPTQSGTTNWQLGDDAISSTINLDFSFDFYGETFTSGKGATNGCWTFTGYNNTCSDYTPDPLPQSGMDMTIFPLWGDWIRDSGSKMLYKTFGDTADTDQYFVMGWYNMREYNRSSDNTFEMLLYEGTNKIEFRYGNLNIVKHDIVVGVQGHATNSSHAMYNANEYKVYLHHNECASGTQHDSYDTNCVNTDWNNTSHNTALENKSLSIVVDDQYGCAANTLLATTCTGYITAYFNQQCGISALYNSECTGYAAAYLTQQCDINSLYSSECSGYTVAYFNQQCGLDTLYNRDCIGYDDAFYDRECTQNSQYDTGCAGYVFETVYYYDDYSYDEYDDYEQYNAYDEFFDDDPYANMEFTDEEWYAIDLEEFGQEQVDDWYGTEVSFNNEGLIVWEDSTLESWDELDIQMDEYDEFIETYEDTFYEEIYYEEEYIIYEEIYDDPIEVAFEYETLSYDIPFIDDVLMQNFEHEQIIEERFYEEEQEHEQEFLEFENVEELEEWFEEEMEMEEEEIVEEEMVEEEVMEEQQEEELLAEEMEEIVEESIEEEEEFEVFAREDDKGEKREMQLNVVASTIQTAVNSMSGTSAGTSIQATGNSVASGGTSSSTTNAVTSSASVGGMSISSSPSISAQFTSATAQTQTILDMSSMASTGGSMSNTMSADNTAVGNTMSADNTAVGNTTSDNNTAVDSDTTVSSETSVNTTVASNTTSANNTAVGNTIGANNTAVGNTISNNNTAVGSMEAEIEMAVANTAEPDNVADKIIASNIKQQQEELEEQQQETGEYADSTTLIAYMGYVQGFDAYSKLNLPQASTWYESRDIYASVSMSDNVPAFYDLYGNSLNGMRELIRLQPNL